MGAHVVLHLYAGRLSILRKSVRMKPAVRRWNGGGGDLAVPVDAVWWLCLGALAGSPAISTVYQSKQDKCGTCRCTFHHPGQ
jgi:hypothetical protein